MLVDATLARDKIQSINTDNSKSQIKTLQSKVLTILTVSSDKINSTIRMAVTNVLWSFRVSLLTVRA